LDPDPLFRGIERNALVIASVLTLAALFVEPRPAVALGVIGGAVLVGVSYWLLKSGVTGIVDLMTKSSDLQGGPRRTAAQQVLKLALRYALLALLAYVMIARLRLHPWGLLAGASSVVAAVSIEAVRLLLKKS
jgi:hypothetical protein